MQSITRSHVESFNFMVEEALPASVQNMRPLEFEVNGRRLKIHIDDVQVGGVRAAVRPQNPNPSSHLFHHPALKYNLQIGMPVAGKRTLTSINTILLPSECRQRKITYRGELAVRVRTPLLGHLLRCPDPPPL